MRTGAGEVRDRAAKPEEASSQSAWAARCLHERDRRRSPVVDWCFRHGRLCFLLAENEAKKEIGGHISNSHEGQSFKKNSIIW